MGMVGAIGFAIFEKPGVPGVTGDLSDDCEDIEPMSARLEEFLREPSEVVESDVFLREKRPMARDNVVVPTYRGMRAGLSSLCDSCSCSSTCQVSRAGGLELSRLEIGVRHNGRHKASV